MEDRLAKEDVGADGAFLGGMVERFITPVLKASKVPGDQSLTQEELRIKALRCAPFRPSICQYAVNAMDRRFADKYC
jgi:hypothetical protein